MALAEVALAEPTAEPAEGPPSDGERAAKLADGGGAVWSVAVKAVLKRRDPVTSKELATLFQTVKY